MDSIKLGTLIVSLPLMLLFFICTCFCDWLSNKQGALNFLKMQTAYLCKCAGCLSWSYLQTLHGYTTPAKKLNEQMFKFFSINKKYDCAMVLVD